VQPPAGTPVATPTTATTDTTAATATSTTGTASSTAVGVQGNGGRPPGSDDSGSYYIVDATPIRPGVVMLQTQAAALSSTQLEQVSQMYAAGC
jgi:hypothetical protein